MPASKARTADDTRQAPDPAPDWATTDPEQQQVAVPEDAVDGEPVDDEPPLELNDQQREMMRQAAEWVKAKKYGPTMTKVIMYLASVAVDTSTLNSVIMEILADKILNATDPDEVIDPFGTVKGRDMFERPLWVSGLTVLMSTVGEGFPFYVAMNVTDPKTKEETVVTVGGEKFVPQIAAFHMRDVWPMAIIIHQSENLTQSGYRVLELRRPT